MEIETRDVEKLLDERVEPMGLVERHARKACTLLKRQIGSFLQERKIAHHAGERRAQIMRQVRNQVIFAMRFIAQGLLNLTLAIARPIERALDLEKSAVDGIPRIGVVDQTVLNTAGDYAVGMLLALLITLVLQGTPAKE